MIFNTRDLLKDITDGELDMVLAHKLMHGNYNATTAFRSIDSHACVCYENGELVAVTGRADDRLSHVYAALFAYLPDMLIHINELSNEVNESVPLSILQFKVDQLRHEEEDGWTAWEKFLEWLDSSSAATARSKAEADAAAEALKAAK